MSSRVETIIAERKQKLDKLRELGVDPYPVEAERKEEIKKARGMEEKEVTVAGRIVGIRGHGGLAFMDLRDETERIQAVLRKNNLATLEWQIKELLDIGDFLQVNGQVFVTKTGEVSIEAKKVKILGKSLRPLPSQWHGLKDVEQRYRQRYLDLILNPEVRKVFDQRTKLVSFLRRFLDQRGFVEVETPILQPVYGGATAKPFKTFHNALKSDFYLRIADELYLKRLVVGGYEKVYEMGKDFRNEGIDRQHNPEFTQLEFYWAYANDEDLIQISQEMLAAAVKEVTGSYVIEYQGEKVDFKPPWDRVSFKELLWQDVGIDIDQLWEEKPLLAAIKQKGLKVDLKGVKGYANILDELYKEYSRSKIKGPIFLVDHPIQMRPLAKKKPGDETKVTSVALLVAGFEVFNAYVELNDPIDQRQRWETEKKLLEAGFEEAQMLDEDYIQALEYGMPPTAGWGMGIDRFTAIVTNQPALKDTIIFPTLRPV